MDKTKREILKHHLNEHHISSSLPIPKSSDDEILSDHRYSHHTNIERVEIESLFVSSSYRKHSYLYNKVIPIVAYTSSSLKYHASIDSVPPNKRGDANK